MSDKHIPVRMCVSCRTRQAKTDFIRIVKEQGIVLIDETLKLPGRGTYICKNAKCLVTAEKKRQLNRALKCEVSEQTYKELFRIIDGGEGNGCS